MDPIGLYWTHARYYIGQRGFKLFEDLILAFKDSFSNYIIRWWIQSRNRFKTQKEPIVKIMEAPMSPSGPIKSCVFHEFTSFQELRPRRKTLSSNWDLDSCPDTSRGGAKEEGVVERNSFPLAIKGLWTRETRQKSLILAGTCSMTGGMAGLREPAGRQWKSTDHFQFPAQECFTAWRK